LPKWMDGGMLPAAHLCTGRHPLHKAAPIRADDEERLDVLRSLSLLDTEPDPAFDRITHAASATLKVWMTPVHQPPCKLAFNPRVPGSIRITKCCYCSVSAVSAILRRVVIARS
jgi:hypothetical protein